MTNAPQAADVDLRRALLDAARRLLVQEGYASLSMRKIARAIGYSATSIYLHFENKDALVHALIEEGMERLQQRLEAAAAEHPDDPVACLQALCRGYLRFGLENREYYEIMFMLRPEQMERYPADKYRRARRNLDVIAAVLARGAAEGLTAPEDVQVRATVIWASLHGAVSLLIARRVDVRIDPEDLVAASVRQVVRGSFPAATQEVTL